MSREFLIGDALSYGWQKMKENFTLFLYIMLTILGICIINALGHRLGFIAIFIVVLVILASLIMKLGIYRITLNIIDKKPVKYDTVYSQTQLFVDFLVGTVLYLLIVLGGLCLLIVPGIIWAIKYQFYGYYIVDKKMTPFDAIKRSGKVTYGHKWKLLWFWFTCVGVNIVGALALLVGLFATIPTTELAYAWTYRFLDNDYVATAPRIGRTRTATRKKKQ